MRVVVFSIFLFLGIASYEQAPRLEGHWRRIEPSFGKITIDKTPKVGDIFFKSDSTYTIVGDTTAAVTDIRGWRTGGEMKGKWSQSGSFLDLTMSDERVPIRFIILKLTAKELVFVNKSLGMRVQLNRL